MRYLALIIFVALSATQTRADDNNAQGAIGSGMSTCAQFAQRYAQRTVVEELFFQWAQGYMTGINAATAKEAGVIRDLNSDSTEDQMAWIREYCNDHPLAIYQDAV
ncbi:MAG: hypothetical protein WA728_21375, partial [Xanthobacteraceae bacterium]